MLSPPLSHSGQTLNNSFCFHTERKCRERGSARERNDFDKEFFSLASSCYLVQEEVLKYHNINRFQLILAAPIHSQLIPTSTNSSQLLPNPTNSCQPLLISSQLLPTLPNSYQFLPTPSELFPSSSQLLPTPSNSFQILPTLPSS